MTKETKKTEETAVHSVKVVSNKRGRVTERVYTRDIHGDGFMELATEFAGKIGGTLVKE